MDRCLVARDIGKLLEGFHERPDNIAGFERLGSGVIVDAGNRDERLFNDSFSISDVEFKGIDATQLTKEQLGALLGPALFHLRESKYDLRQIAVASSACGSGLAWNAHRVLNEYALLARDDAGKAFSEKREGANVLIEDQAHWFLGHIESASHGPPGKPSFDISKIRSSLDSCETAWEYISVIENCFHETEDNRIVVPIWRVREERPHAVPNMEKDYTHQDTRDIERDILVLNGTLIRGDEIGYSGVIEEIVKAIQKCERSVSWHSEKKAVNSVHHKAALTRFARALLSTANRTNSGGNAFESIEMLFGGTSHALIVPDSDAANPLQIDIFLHSFEKGGKQNISSNDSDVCTHQEYGVVAKITACTEYYLRPPENIENTLGKLSGEYHQSLAMSFPVPEHKSLLSLDDRRNQLNKQDYRIFENPIVLLDGQADISYQRQAEF